jgi:8-oxo-dGTP pyrophosphatase MutT (NUDIX family)
MMAVPGCCACLLPFATASSEAPRLTKADPNRKRSAGIIVLRQVPGDWRLLLLRAFRNWDFPKGQIAVGEDPLAAALREAREETGLTDLAFSWGDVFRETEPYAGGKIARFYVAQTRTERIELPVSPELGRPEHHEWRWVSFDEARELLAPRLRFIVDWAESVAIGSAA